ncbi:MAG: metal-sensing transcriptional repressor [Magnetococcales bacterium]|nr:metal-sensing transcriptional repressor [Magnetococcales bacterium]
MWHIDKGFRVSTHSSHEAIVKRLKRASGHLNRVIEMIESNRPCPDVAQQFHAVTNALNNAKRAFVMDHIEHCIHDGLSKEDADVKQLLEELKDMTKYLA